MNVRGLRRAPSESAPTPAPAPSSTQPRVRRGPAPLEPSWALLFGLSPTPAWRRWSAVALIPVCLFAAILTYTEQVRAIHVGFVAISLSAFPGFVLAILIGRALVGRRTDHETFVTFWACAVVVLSVAVIGFSRLSHPIDLVGLAVASVDEELVFRLALPVFLAAALVGFGLSRKWSRVIGYTLAGAAWVLLPGHRAQMHNIGEVLTFVEFALLMAVICLRSGSVLATATAHVCSNLLTVLVWREVLPQDDRSLMFGGLLALMLLAYGMRLRSPRAHDGAPAPIGVDDIVVDLRNTGRPEPPRLG